MKRSAFLFVLMIMGMVSASAVVSSSFSNFVVKAYSQNTELGTYKNTIATRQGQIRLSAMEMNKAVFTASYLDGTTWRNISGETIYDTITETRVISYGANRPANTFVKVKVKNNNWTNVTRKISGTYYVNGDV